MSDKTTLAKCPIGLFLSADGYLCLKTEYGDNEGRIDAYIVASGEAFWGGPPQTKESQRQEQVTPFDLRDAIMAAYCTGARDVHDNWQEDPDPDFGEAAADYFVSLGVTP